MQIQLNFLFLLIKILQIIGNQSTIPSKSLPQNSNKLLLGICISKDRFQQICANENVQVPFKRLIKPFKKNRSFQSVTNGKIGGFHQRKGKESEKMLLT